MHRNEHFLKVARVFIVALLCSELQSNFIMQGANLSPVAYAYASNVNTTYASLEDSTHHASIRISALDKDFGEGHICSGALIAPSVVITAAQCVFNYVKNFQRHPSELRVVVGTLNRYQRMEHTLVYGVTHLYTMPTFDSQTLRDNIAILMLESDVDGHSHIRPIAMKQFSSETVVFDEAKVTSWGATPKGEPVPLLMLSNATISYDIPCYRHMICINFMDTVHNVCPSDAGAPLSIGGELVGLSFTSNDCSVKSNPVIFLDIRKHHDWILSKIGDGTNQNSSVWGTLGFLVFTAFAFKTANFNKRRRIAGL